MFNVYSPKIDHMFIVLKLIICIVYSPKIDDMFIDLKSKNTFLQNTKHGPDKQKF